MTGTFTCKVCGRSPEDCAAYGCFVPKKEGMEISTEGRMSCACGKPQYSLVKVVDPYGCMRDDEAYVCAKCGGKPPAEWQPEQSTALYQKTGNAEHDPVNHPKHYTQHPSGIECIQITEHMGFCLGNAVKYIWRADLKHDAIEDLEKAKWYLEREIALRKGKA